MSARIWRWRRSGRHHDINSLAAIRRGTLDVFGIITRNGEELGIATPDDLAKMRKFLMIDRDPLTASSAKELQMRLRWLVADMRRRDKGRRREKRRSALSLIR